MSIKVNSNGTFRVSYCARHPITRIPQSLRRIRNDRGNPITSRAEAQRIYNQLVVEVSKKFHRTVAPTWIKVVNSYCENMRNQNLTKKTIETYGLCLRAHTFEEWGNRTLDEITTQDIRTLIQEKVGHRSPSHQKNLLKFIRGAFKYAVECGHIQRNPAPEMKFRIGDKLKKVLTEPQLRLLLSKAKEYGSEWYYHWCMATYTGMRNGELYALTWDQVNFDSRQILVDCAWNNKDGFKSTKSGDDRIVGIAPNLLVLLKELKLQAVDTIFVLPRIDKWDKGEQARELRLFLMGLGLPTIRFHDLRATWATMMLCRGVEPIKVMKMGGWKDIKTMQHYVRKAGVDIEGITNTLDLHDPHTTIASVVNIIQN